MPSSDSILTVAHISVPRTARYYMVGVPSALVRDVWIVCHGYGQLAARFIEQFTPFVSETRLILAPEALSRFYLDTQPQQHSAESRVGALWMTREDREAEIGDIVTYLDAVARRTLDTLRQAGASRVRLHALGFSQGAPAASRWAARGTVPVDHLVVWGSGVPDDVNLRVIHERHPGFVVESVAGLQDAWVTSDALAKQEALLKASGAPYQMRTFDGGHSLDDGVLGEMMGNSGGVFR